MARQSIFDMKVSKIYPLLLQKVERKGRSKEELDTAIKWLTGYDMDQVDQEMTYGDFFQAGTCHESEGRTDQRKGMRSASGNDRRSHDAEGALAGQAGG